MVDDTEVKNRIVRIIRSVDSFRIVHEKAPPIIRDQREEIDPT